MQANQFFDPQLLSKYNTSGPRYTSYPTALEFHDEFAEKDFIKAVKDSPNRELSLYVHIPFCHSLCYYCGCNKVITRHRDKADTYLEFLAEEISSRAEFFTEYTVKQLHWGGGTPSFLTHTQITKLVTLLIELADQEPNMAIAKDTVVQFHYTLKDADGTVIEASHGNEPMAYLHGHGNIIPGLEEEMAGKEAGAEFVVNTHDIALQPSVTALKDGGFVVVWGGANENNDDYSMGISGQQFDRLGNKQGGEFQVNTNTANEQFMATVTGLNDGGYMVTWQSQDPLTGDNDGYGIAAQRYDLNGNKVGDEFLVAVAKVIQKELRTTDIIARFGGEEFVAILPEINLNDANIIASRVAIAISRQVIVSTDGKDLSVSASVGVTQRKQDENIDEALKRADDFLYFAKENGRDRVISDHEYYQASA